MDSEVQHVKTGILLQKPGQKISLALLGVDVLQKPKQHHKQPVRAEPPTVRLVQVVVRQEPLQHHEQRLDRGHAAQLLASELDRLDPEVRVVLQARVLARVDKRDVDAELSHGELLAIAQLLEVHFLRRERAACLPA